MPTSKELAVATLVAVFMLSVLGEASFKAALLPKLGEELVDGTSFGVNLLSITLVFELCSVPAANEILVAGSLVDVRDGFLVDICLVLETSTSLLGGICVLLTLADISEGRFD